MKKVLLRSRFKTFGLIIVILLIFKTEESWSLSKLEVKEKIEAASQKYSEEQYSEAIGLYEEVTESGYTSAAIWHNLGLAYFKNGQLAEAIIALERARRIFPNNKNINHDLRLIRENVNSEIISAPPFFLVRWYNAVVSTLSSKVWLGLHLFFLGLFLGGMYLYLIRKNLNGWHHTYIEGALIGIVCVSVIFAIFSYSRAQMIFRNDIGVITSDQIVLRLGAEDNTEVIMELNEGVKVYIEDKIGDFLKVRLEDYTEGWVKESEVEII